MKHIDTADAVRLHAEGAQLVEVLPAEEHAREHIPGACSLPLQRLTRDAADAALDRGRPVVTYCHDHECDLSARAAAVLEAYGFAEVYDFTASKTAWLAAGLPSEGSVRDDERAGALADRDVATCAPDDLAASLAADVTVVVDHRRIVLGLVDGRVAALPNARVGDVMQTGPASVRPSILRHELAASMDRSGVTHVLVTTPGGALIGLVTRDRLDRA